MKAMFLGLRNGFSNELLALGFTPRSELHLVENHNYDIYGISIWRNVTGYLMIPTGEPNPDWMPAELFHVTDPRLPRNWFYFYSKTQNSHGVTHLMSYKEMVTDENHYIDLIEREPDALKVFMFRKKEMEEDITINNS
jgi:hypothetical protein